MRLAHSDVFWNSEMQQRLLSYLAEKPISGDADQLKEYTAGLDAFGKPETYDLRRDSTVRMQCGNCARRSASTIGAKVPPILP